MKGNFLLTDIFMHLIRENDRLSIRLFSNTISYFLFFFTLISFSQNSKSYWVDLEEIDLSTIKINSSGNFNQNGFYFEVIWDENMGSMENQQGNYSGISSLKISTWKKELINSFSNIKDEVGLGEILISFYDFNLDGQIDFKIIRECGKRCYSSYFLYNKDLERFEHEKSWNYVKIEKINKKEKLLSLHKDDHRENKIYRLNENSLIKVNNY